MIIKFPESTEFKGIIGVCGAAQISTETYHLAEKLGEEIARHKYLLVCGGLYGTMEAVCKGAKREGGFTIGILPTDSPAHANSYVDLPIPTGLGEARNMVLVSTAEGIITVGGASGTLIEIAYAWRIGKPIVALEPTGGWSAEFAGKQIDATRSDTIIAASNPRDAVEKVIKKIKGLDEKQ